MASRGSVAVNCCIKTDEYETVSVTPKGVKILIGKGNKHSLPDYAHTAGSIYAKLDNNGLLREMRFYDNEHKPVFEIGYHVDSKFKQESSGRVLHYHTFGSDLSRVPGKLMTDELKEKYKDYLKEFNLYYD